MTGSKCSILIWPLLETSAINVFSVSEIATEFDRFCVKLHRPYLNVITINHVTCCLLEYHDNCDYSLKWRRQGVYKVFWQFRSINRSANGYLYKNGCVGCRESESRHTQNIIHARHLGEEVMETIKSCVSVCFFYTVPGVNLSLYMWTFMDILTNRWKKRYFFFHEFWKITYLVYDSVCIGDAYNLMHPRQQFFHSTELGKIRCALLIHFYYELNERGCIYYNDA